jgi:hypothetical protein
VSSGYKAPFRFAGTIKKLEIDLAPEKLGAADLGRLKKTHALVHISE